MPAIGLTGVEAWLSPEQSGNPAIKAISFGVLVDHFRRKAITTEELGWAQSDF
jgi:hypothetical protein